MNKKTINYFTRRFKIMNEQDRLYDAKVRWQETRVNQFSYVNYLILTLSLATLGFAVSLVTENYLFRTAMSTLFFWLHLFSVFCVLVSIGSGIFCAYTRLKDFRKTAKITRLKYERGNLTATPKIKKLRCKTKKLGKRSWCFLQCQIWLFGIGLVALISAITVWRFDML